MEAVTGKDLIKMGYAPAKWFGEALNEINKLPRQTESDVAFVANRYAEQHEREIAARVPLQNAEDIPVHVHLEAVTDDEQVNYDKVMETMATVVQTPYVVEAAIMPDACPAGPVGTIPVGGVVKTRGTIHPGMHSADVCCSVAMSVLPRDLDLPKLMDAAHAATHFGGGGRARGQQVPMPKALMEKFEGHPYLRDLLSVAREHFATQGDGNHFLFVGHSEQDDHRVIITHHGSRKPGGMLYKRGMKMAEALTRKQSPDTLKQNSWLEFDSEEGQLYWSALQIIAEWTEASHWAIHNQALARYGLEMKHILGRVFSPHNFVFRDGDYFNHAKGATPVGSEDWGLIPMNMAEPVLLVSSGESKTNLGFCPHGAGRNFSRSEHRRRLGDDRPDAEIFAEETEGIDARFFSGVIDTSELPSAYKCAKTMQRQMHDFELARVHERFMPHGSIMAGDWMKPKREARGND